jgi:hypothetical protein
MRAELKAKSSGLGGIYVRLKKKVLRYLTCGLRG